MEENWSKESRHLSVSSAERKQLIRHFIHYCKKGVSIYLFSFGNRLSVSLNFKVHCTFKNTFSVSLFEKPLKGLGSVSRLCYDCLFVCLTISSTPSSLTRKQNMFAQMHAIAKW